MPSSRHRRWPLPRRDPPPPSSASPRLPPHRGARSRPPPGGSAQPNSARARRGDGQDPSSNPAARLPFSHPDSDRRRRNTARNRTFTGSTSKRGSRASRAGVRPDPGSPPVREFHPPPKVSNETLSHCLDFNKERFQVSGFNKRHQATGFRYCGGSVGRVVDSRFRGNDGEGLPGR